MEDTLQPTIDLVLNMAIFIWLGAVCPWRSFVDGSVVPVERLFLLGILVLLLRRLPVIFLLRRMIPQIVGGRDALFMGFFGPIGISAIFYCYLGVEFLGSLDENPAAERLQETMLVVVWFLVTASVVSRFFFLLSLFFFFFFPISCQLIRFRRLSTASASPSLCPGTF